MRTRRILGTALVVALAVAAGLSASSAQAADKIRLGVLPFSETLGAIIADKKGYFKEAGIDLETSSFNSGALALPLLQAGKLDITFNNTVSTLQALEQGLDLTLLAPGAVVRQTAPDSTSTLLALKGKIKSAKDYEGKRIAVNVINSSNWLYTVAYLDSIGVDRTKVRFVEIPFPQMMDPLLNGQVDAVGVSEPFRTVIQDTGKVDVLAASYVVAQPNGDITQYIALTEWVKKNPDLAQRFAKAILKGAAFANTEANQAEVRQINMEFTRLNPALKDSVQLPLFGSAINPGEIGKTMELMLKYGMMKKPVDLAGRILAVK